jgi:hypothetical protein
MVEQASSQVNNILLQAYEAGAVIDPELGFDVPIEQCLQ